MPKAKEETDQSSILESLTKQYHAAAKKSCGAYIEMAETVVRADQELTGAALGSFYRAVHRDSKGSTVRKMRLIGQHSSRFKPYLDLLPAHWTTLWQLARRTPEDLERLKASGALHPHATWAELEKALGSGSKRQKKKKDANERIYFDLAPIPHQRRLDFVNRVTELGKEFDIKPQPTRAADALIKRLRKEAVGKKTSDVQERGKEIV